jgi:hypothetical protein
VSTSLPPPDPDAIDEGWDALDVPVAPANSPIHSSSPPARTLTAEPPPEAKVQVALVLPSSVSAQLDRPAAAAIPPAAPSSVSAVAAPQKKIATDVSAVATPKKEIATDVSVGAAPQKKIATDRSERGKAKLQAKSKEQVAARAAKKAAKKMAKQAERRDRAQRNSRAAADEAASKRQPQRSASSNNGTAERVRKVPRAASSARAISSEAENMVVAPAVHTESWFKRTLSGSIALLLVTLLLLAGLGWFLWPRS